MDKNPVKQSAKIIVANAKTKLTKLKNNQPHPTTEIKIETKRKLTSGEIKMCQLVFKDAIDYSKVWIHIGGYIHNATGNAMTPAGEIMLPRSEYMATSDFSKASGDNRHWFIHEMVHVWQYQMGTPSGWLGLKQLCKGGYTSMVTSVDSGGELKAYDTDILGRDFGKKFNEFNFEQQGRLIEFWFDACYLQNVDPERVHHRQSLKLLGYVERILRDFILNPHDKTLLPRS
ncbi:MAG TPA: zinc protease [Acinetobacter nosocomialis]|nr:zinc protease [Acinetobacter nosocomialis]